MKQKLLLLMMIATMLFQVAILPASASGKWDYVLKNYPNPSDQKIVKDYLDEFHSALHLTWYSPVYKHLYLRDVIFDLNRDGSISNIQVHTYYGYGSLEPYTKGYDKYIRDFLSEMKFKPFPTTIKEDKIKMGYEFKSKCAQYFLRAANVYNKSDVIFARYNISQ